MPDFTQLLSPGRIRCRVELGSKKRCLQTLADMLADQTEDGVSARQVFDKFCERERLGSTGLGKGIAIPHARLAGLEQPRAALLTVAEAVDFDAVDGAPVDLLIALLVPGNADQTHLELLADIARRFNDADFGARLRAADNDDALRLSLDLRLAS